VVQYSGRHICQPKSSMVVVVASAPGVTGKIQVGAVPGASAQVMVPTCGVPLAAGTEPNPPVELAADPLGVLLAQAARPRAAAIAQAAHRSARLELVVRFTLNRSPPVTCLAWRSSRAC